MYSVYAIREIPPSEKMAIYAVDKSCDRGVDMDYLVVCGL